MYDKIKTLAVMLFVGGLLGANIFSDAALAPPLPIPTPQPAQIPGSLPVIVKSKDNSPVSATKNSGVQLSNVQKRTSPNESPKSPYPERLGQGGDFIVNNDRYPLRKYKVLATANDASASQWWVTGTGLPAAWDYSNGLGTKIAIIDTGFALSHEEFAGRWLDNAGESGLATGEYPSRPNCTARGLPLSQACNLIDDDSDGIVDNETGPTTQENPSWLNCTDRGQPRDKLCNGIDDDSNGLIDDFRGWDFNAGDASVQAGQLNAAGEAVSHGTSVSGVAGATGNNSVGIAGVSWATKILPLQVLGDDGNGDTLGVSRAVRYAADRDVDVINLSLGSDEEDPYLRQAIQYALEKGVVVVAAAGNDGCDCLSYPARYPEVLAVGAGRSDGTVASFSSYGENLDIIAPGASIQAPSWTQSTPSNSYSSGLAGTSFAAPYVSGLLANARAKQPNASWNQLVNIMLQKADHRTLTPSAPRSNTLGFGYARADDFMARVSLPYTQLMRYSFTVDSGSAPGTSAAIECGGQFPTVPFYQIRLGTTVYYSINALTIVTQQNNGATVTPKGHVCAGLPTDQVTISRQIDPVREFSNLTPK